MKIKKLLGRVQKFLDAKERARRKQVGSMREVLDALKQQERQLKSRAKAETDPDTRAKMEKKREVVHAQRKKGLVALKALKRG